MSIVNVGDTENFTYTGDIQEFVVPITGWYELTCIGASSGNTDHRYVGQGGTTVSYEYLTAGTILFVVVGGCGNVSEEEGILVDGGFNGGGSYSTPSGIAYSDVCVCSGGGATHIAMISGILKDIVIDHISEIFNIAGGGSGYISYKRTIGSNTTITTMNGGGGNSTIFDEGIFGYGDGVSGGGYHSGVVNNVSNGYVYTEVTGGSGYIRDNNEKDIDGVIYTPSMTKGSSSGGKVYTKITWYGKHGSAKITLLKKGFSNILINGNNPGGIIFNGISISKVVFNGVEL